MVARLVSHPSLTHNKPKLIQILEYCRFLEFALSHNALIISPDHRLLPEANGTDVLDDVEAFSNWMHDELPSIADRESWHASPDLGRVAAIGASSGGYLAMQMALLFSTKIDVKALMCVCAPLNGIGSGSVVPRGPRRILGSWPPPPRQAEALIRDYIRGIKSGTVRSEGDPLDMWPMLLSLVRECFFPILFLSILGNTKSFNTHSPEVNTYSLSDRASLATATPRSPKEPTT
jgi:pimeloyl-ACP methyl ester carboxylesterase